MAIRVRFITLCPSLASIRRISLLALGQHQFERGRLTLASGKPGPLGADLAVGKPDSLGQLVEDFTGGASGHEGAVDFSTPYRG